MRKLLLILTFFYSFRCAAQVSPFTFTNYNTSNGLTDNTIQSLCQDSDGFLWIGTREGLSRFDGDRFLNFYADKKNSDQLSGNSVTDILEYAPSKMVMLADGKLSLLNTKTKKFSVLASAANRICYHLNTTVPGIYSLSTLDTVYVLNNKMEEVEKLVPPVSKHTMAIDAFFLDSNTAITGTSFELFLYNRKLKTYTPFLNADTIIQQLHLKNKNSSFNFKYYDAATQKVYFSNFFEGLFELNLKGQLLYHWKPVGFAGQLATGNISFIKQMSPHTLWVGSFGNGLFILNTQTKTASKIEMERNDKFSLADNSVHCMITDKDGNEWIGTKNGLCKINASNKIITNWRSEIQQKTSLPDYNLLAVSKAADDNMYFTLFGLSTIFRINNDNTLENIAADKNIAIWQMCNFGNELVFSGSTKYILRYDPLKKQFSKNNFPLTYFPNSDVIIFSFKQKNGDGWFSGNAGGGLIRFSKNGTVHTYKKGIPGLTSGYYSVAVEDRNGDMWFAVNKSNVIAHWDHNTDKFSEVSPANARQTKTVNFNVINDLAIDTEDNLWIGFDGNGLVKYNVKKNESFLYNKNNGLPGNYVMMMRFDNKNRLWLGTTKGLSCFLPKENKFINFSREDGIADDVFNERCSYFDSSTNQLYIGSTTTLMKFNPDSLLLLHKKQFNIYIDNILLNGNAFSFSPGTTISFRPFENNLQFEFTGVDINNGKDIEYSYKLEGADKDWVYNNEATTASYANLNSGKYSFHVRARHKGDNEWNELAKPFVFTIATPWFKTWWFALLVTIALISLLILLIRNYYRRKLEKQKVVLENEQAIERERTRMARELHDGLGSMLSGIKHSFNALQNQLSLDNTQQNKFDYNIEKLNESIVELRNISHSMASDALLKYGLENSLKDYCSNLGSPDGLNITFTALNTDHLFLQEDKAFHVFRIVQELLQNVIKHAAAKNVIVQMSCNEKTLYIAVEDDGKGFGNKNADTGKGIGLRNIETRIKLVKGRIDIQSSQDGTSVLMEIPADTA